MKPLRMALTKGRLEKDTVALLERIGYDCEAVHNKGRKLILPVGDRLEVVLAKAADVITYVEHGVCDLGVVGKDTIMENGTSFYEVLDLGFGKCRMAVAGFPEGKRLLNQRGDFRVGSKYPEIARRYFLSRHQQPLILKLNGSVELAPIVGLADVIVDIVETGSTLAANGLVVLDAFLEISARMVVNKASMKLHAERINGLIQQMSEALRRMEDGR